VFTAIKFFLVELGSARNRRLLLQRGTILAANHKSSVLLPLPEAVGVSLQTFPISINLIVISCCEAKASLTDL